MRKYNTILIFIFIIMQAHICLAQKTNKVKEEREERISLEEFPSIASNVITQLKKSSKKVKYYKETDGYLITYEAKYKYKSHKYSAEFDTNGNIIDVERQIKKKEIPSTIVIDINEVLDSISTRFRIEKIQEQYLFENREASFIQSQLKQKNFKNYEIIVAFKENQKIYRKELLFSKEGELLKQRDVKRLGYDFLLF